MGKRLKMQLLPNWATAAVENGPATIRRVGENDAGDLQVSIIAEYTGGELPNPSAADLVELAQEHGHQHDVGALVDKLSGPCGLGSYGSAVFSSPAYPRIQFWYLSNGRDFVLATHICTVEPTADEVAEAQQIVETIGLSEDSSG